MILIVDDRPENILSLKSILDLHAFPVDTALSGEEALKKTLKNSYALIILDVQMPGMDGFEVAEVLSGNNLTRDIPIIFLSAVNTEKKFITQGYSSGAIDYIVKPIDPDILLLKVKTFYRLYEQNRELNIMQSHLKSEVEFRKKAQQETQDKAQELYSILESIPQIAFTATPSGNIDFVNDQWYKYAASTIRFPEAHPDDPGIDEQWAAAVEKGEQFETETRIKKIRYGDYRCHLLRAIPVKEEGKIMKWVGSFTDIEEQKQAIKRKDEFLTIASHELKTPLTSIKAYVQLLERIIPKESNTLTYVERSLLQVNKLDSLINDLLDLSRIESGKLTFDLEEVDFESFLSNSLAMLQQIYTTQKIERIGKAPVTIMANAIRLEQVIINFISNAIKYAPESPINVITEIREGNRLYVGVQDFGIGIDKENQKNIFTKFYRVNESGAHVTGLGIGLHICAEILKRHDAVYGVESEPGKGSVFYFILPIVASTE